LISFVVSKLNHSGREVALVTPTSAPTPTATISPPSSDPAFYNNRGSDFLQRKDYDKAISDCNEAIRLDPNFARAYFNRGLAFREQGNYKRAQADFNKAEQLGYTGPQ
jgi:tetratricopeptide (TPR) repeat protein